MAFLGMAQSGISQAQGNGLQTKVCQVRQPDSMAECPAPVECLDPSVLWGNAETLLATLAELELNVRLDGYPVMTDLPTSPNGLKEPESR